MGVVPNARIGSSPAFLTCINILHFACPWQKTRKPRTPTWGRAACRINKRNARREAHRVPCDLSRSTILSTRCLTEVRRRFLIHLPNGTRQSPNRHEIHKACMLPQTVVSAQHISFCSDQFRVWSTSFPFPGLGTRLGCDVTKCCFNTTLPLPAISIFSCATVTAFRHPFFFSLSACDRSAEPGQKNELTPFSLVLHWFYGRYVFLLRGWAGPFWVYCLF